MILATAYLLAPWVGIDPDAPTTAHRVDTGGLPIATWETAEFAEARCGLLVKLLELPWKDLRTRGTKVHRCPTCRAGSASR